MQFTSSWFSSPEEAIGVTEGWYKASKEIIKVTDCVLLPALLLTSSLPLQITQNAISCECHDSCTILVLFIKIGIGINILHVAFSTTLISPGIFFVSSSSIREQQSIGSTAFTSSNLSIYTE